MNATSPREASKTRRSVSALLMILATWIDISAAQNGSTPRKQAPTDDNTKDIRLHTESNLVVLRAVVKDRQGKAVQDLHREDFKVFDKGKEQAITQFEAVSFPANSVTAVSDGNTEQAQASKVRFVSPPSTFLSSVFR